VKPVPVRINVVSGRTHFFRDALELILVQLNGTACCRNPGEAGTATRERRDD